jgi:hypothetical protein
VRQVSGQICETNTQLIWINIFNYCRNIIQTSHQRQKENLNQKEHNYNIKQEQHNYDI